VRAVLSGLEFDPDPTLLPEDPAQMMTHLTILVRAAPDGGGEMFQARLCSPEWVAAQPEATRLMPGLGLLIVRFEDFDQRRVRLEIERFLGCIDEESWAKVAMRIKEWFPIWEFDGYST
jgi:Immunity protein 8